MPSGVPGKSHRRETTMGGPQRLQMRSSTGATSFFVVLLVLLSYQYLFLLGLFAGDSLYVFLFKPVSDIALPAELLSHVTQ